MTYQARVTEDGKLEIMPEALAAIGLTPGDIVDIEADGTRLVLRPDLAGALARLRDVFRGYSVEQFLADRRADWKE